MNRYIFVICLGAIILGVAWCFQPLKEAETQDRIARRNQRRAKAEAEAAASRAKSSNPLARSSESQLADGSTDVSSGVTSGTSVRSQIDQRLTSATVRIVDASQKVLGLGVTVARRADRYQVLTALHPITGDSPLFVDFNPLNATSSSSIAAKLLSKDEHLDLALLEVVSAEQPASEVSLANGDAGTEEAATDDVATGGSLGNAESADSGFPMAAIAVDWPTSSDRPQLVDIDVSGRETIAVRDGEEPHESWIVDGDLPWLAGSGIFNRRGQLLGIASSQLDGVSYFVHTREIRAFLSGE